MFNDMFILDLHTRLWSKVEILGDEVPPARYGHSTTVIGRQLLVFGGCGEGQVALNDLWIFDLESLIWIQPEISGDAPEPRFYHSASLIGDKILFFGGKRGRTSYNDFIIFDIEFRSWNPIEMQAVYQDQNLIGRAYHTANVVSDCMVCIIGGYSGSSMVEDILLIDLSGFKWISYSKEGPKMTRCKMTTNLVGDKLLIFGGHDGSKFLNEMCIIGTDSLQQFIRDHVPAARKSLANDHLKFFEPPLLKDKENAMVYNTEGYHVQPQLLNQHLETLQTSLAHMTAQLKIFDDEQLEGFVESLTNVMNIAQTEINVRKEQSERKKQKQVKFGAVHMREHKRAVGHGNVTSDGGPALGVDSKYADVLMRRLSSYENLREAVRKPREEYMRSGYVKADLRAQLLLKAGSSRGSMDQYRKEVVKVKNGREETASCALGALISEAGQLPSTTSKFTEEESKNRFNE